MVTEAVVTAIEKVERPYQAGVGLWLFVMATAAGLQLTSFGSQWFDVSIGGLPPFWSAHLYALLLFLVPVGSAVIRKAIAHVESDPLDEPTATRPDADERETGEPEPEREPEAARRGE